MIQQNLLIIFFYLIAAAVVQMFVEPLQHLVTTRDNYLDASWIFLPHGVRVLSVILVGYYSFPGLFLAAFLHGFVFFNLSDEISIILISSLLSTCATMIAFRIHCKQLTLALDDITLALILKLSVTTSIISSMLINSYRYIISDNIVFIDDISQILLYFIGDNFGAVVFFLMIVYIRKKIFYAK